MHLAEKKNFQNYETKVCSVSLIIRRWVAQSGEMKTLCSPSPLSNLAVMNKNHFIAGRGKGIRKFNHVHLFGNLFSWDKIVLSVHIYLMAVDTNTKDKGAF